MSRPNDDVRFIVSIGFLVLFQRKKLEAFKGKNGIVPPMVC